MTGEGLQQSSRERQPGHAPQSQLLPQSTRGSSASALHFASHRSPPQAREPSLHALSAAQSSVQGPLPQETTVPLHDCLPVQEMSHGNSAGHETVAFSHAWSPVQTT
jgi:hypothetical protein